MSSYASQRQALSAGSPSVFLSGLLTRCSDDAEWLVGHPARRLSPPPATAKWEGLLLPL